MHPKLTGKAYDDITDLWSEDKFNNKNAIAQHKRSLKFVVARGTALDIGCGCNSRLFKLLSEEGFVYEGLDISEKMIALARLQHPDVTFYHEDLCAWENPKLYDYITAWDSIWHIPLDQQEAVIRKLVSALNPGGILIFSFGGTEEADEHSNELMGPMVYYSTLGTTAYLQLIASAGCICRHLEYDQHPEPHAYIIAQKTLKKKRVLLNGNPVVCCLCYLVISR